MPPRIGVPEGGRLSRAIGFKFKRMIVRCPASARFDPGARVGSIGRKSRLPERLYERLGYIRFRGACRERAGAQKCAARRRGIEEPPAREAALGLRV